MENAQKNAQKLNAPFSERATYQAEWDAQFGRTTCTDLSNMPVWPAFFARRECDAKTCDYDRPFK